MPVLREVAQILKAHPEMTLVEVQGHTDAVGTDEYNRELSQRRVDNVRSWLVAEGVEASRLVAKGYGESQAKGSVDSETERAADRRVVFIVLTRE